MVHHCILRDKDQATQLQHLTEYMHNTRTVLYNIILESVTIIIVHCTYAQIVLDTFQHKYLYEMKLWWYIRHVKVRCELFITAMEVGECHLNNADTPTHLTNYRASEHLH